MGTVRIARACECGCADMTIGRSLNTAGSVIYPFVCSACGEVQTQYASRKAAQAWERGEGPLPDVLTKTMRKPGIFARYARARQEQCCEVCGASEAERHHWAPYHLFGNEADKWPTGLLCRTCHVRWHQIVTPNMGA